MPVGDGANRTRGVTGEEVDIAACRLRPVKTNPGVLDGAFVSPERNAALRYRRAKKGA